MNGHASGAALVDAASGTERYGNLYSDLLDYVVFSVLIFYVLTIAGLFVLRRKRPDAERPYRAFGYPLVPALYIVAAATITVVLLLYKTQTTWPGLLLVLSGRARLPDLDAALREPPRGLTGPPRAFRTGRRRIASPGSLGRAASCTKRSSAGSTACPT